MKLEFERWMAREKGSGTDPSVRHMRGWLAEFGMDIRVERLIVATYAELSQRAWVRAAEIVDPPESVDDVQDDMQLRSQEMPDKGRWAIAVERAGALFGKPVDARVISPRAVARLSRISAQADELRAPAAELVSVLESSLSRLGVAGEPVSERLRTAEVAESLLTALHRANGPVDLVAALADHPCDDVPLSTLSRSLHSASEVVRALRNAEWQVLDRLPTLRHPDAVGVRDTLRTGAASNEIAAPLAKVLTDAKNRTLQLIVALEPPAP
ncbi:MAG TPA: hypothetical protein VE196_07310, partial [Pseudonocardiaceae bacterium]|nr:hypothetical protein [Pseudonocardiaceae bacterium]